MYIYIHVHVHVHVYTYTVLLCLSFSNIVGSTDTADSYKEVLKTCRRAQRYIHVYTILHVHIHVYTRFGVWCHWWFHYPAFSFILS